MNPTLLLPRPVRRRTATGWLRSPAAQIAPRAAGRWRAPALWMAAVLVATLWPAPHTPAAPPSDHWAYRPPLRPRLPLAGNASWVRNPIDAFTLTRMHEHDLEPQAEADKTTLVRRLTLGVTGLPPTLAEIDAFLADQDPAAYEHLVRRLLASPRYGERMATPWLDLARYADSHGYHMDAHREMSAWRDWVIDALNDNMPYDQFTIEQLAGDLLPAATPSQIIASGFNRNHMINFEGGALEAEYLIEYAVDRTVTTATVWLGQTMQCARCHDHKYDPFTQIDFYRLLAFFNQIPDKGIDGDQGNAEPIVRAASAPQRLQRQRVQRRIGEYDDRLRRRAADCDNDLRAWEQRLAAQRGSARPPADMVLHVPLDEVVEATTLDQVSGARLPVHGPAFLPPTKFERALLFGGDTIVEVAPDGPAQPPLDFQANDAFTLAAWIYPTTGDRMTILAKQSDAPMARGYALLLDDDQLIASLTSDQTTSRIQVRAPAPVAQRQWQHVTVTYDGSGRAQGLRIYVDGLRRETTTVHDDLRGSIRTTKPLRIGQGAEDAPFRGAIDEIRIYPRALTPTEAGLLAGGDPIGEILAVQPARRTPLQAEALRTYYLRHHDPTYQELSRQRAAALRALSGLDDAIRTTMVMRAIDQPRPTFILSNGLYDSPTDPVAPGTPASLFPLAEEAPRNRLGLARWIVDPRNPLTARVAVNHIWQQHFGSGLVRTPEDFGTRGQPPSHPQLLDWLADELVRSGWDVKHLHELILTSATYRQSSRAAVATWQRDPTNRWLARGPRRRLPAEMIRDQALATSGLLCEQLGGPSVFPYQPAGLWKELSYDPNEFTAQVYRQDHGARLYRRSLYTFWKRSVPAPALATLGVPNREVCVARRSPSNTPLEALVLMNETALVEASRAFAQRILREGGAADRSRIDWAFRLATGRPPTDAERAVVAETLQQQRTLFQGDVAGARQLLSVGESAWQPTHDPRELAAWTLVANLLFCLDETISTH